LWREDGEVCGGGVFGKHICGIECAFEGGEIVFLAGDGDISRRNEEGIDDLDDATGEGEVALDEGASAALAADKSDYVPPLFEDLNSQTASDISPAG
jgi:hypothetical protein